MAVADLSNRTPEAPWRTCAVCHALNGLDVRQREILTAALSNPLVRYSEIEDELATDPAFQVELDRQALSRHARGQCAAKAKLR